MVETKGAGGQPLNTADARIAAYTARGYADGKIDHNPIVLREMLKARANDISKMADEIDGLRELAAGYIARYAKLVAASLPASATPPTQEDDPSKLEAISDRESRRGTAFDGEGAACYDCGLPYSDDGFADLVVPSDVWAKISPTGHDGGLLCPTCLVRATKRAGFADGAVYASFGSGPFSDRELHQRGADPVMVAGLRVDAVDTNPVSLRNDADAIRSHAAEYRGVGKSDELTALRAIATFAERRLYACAQAIERLSAAPHPASSATDEVSTHARAGGKE